MDEAGIKADETLIAGSGFSWNAAKSGRSDFQKQYSDRRFCHE